MVNKCFGCDVGWGDITIKENGEYVYSTCCDSCSVLDDIFEDIIDRYSGAWEKLAKQ